MPKKHYVAPASDSCCRIRRLVERHLPEVLDNAESEKDVLVELSSIDNGKFHRRIEDLRAIGRRLPDRESIERVLTENEIDHNTLKSELGVDRSTLTRFFKGESATVLRERILNHFPKLFRGFPYPHDRDEFFAGYNHAVITIRKQLLAALSASRVAKPPLTYENFCFLWHSLRVESWRLAMRNGDLSSLESAVAMVAQQVQKDPPTYKMRSYKTIQDLIDLHEEWGLWFRLVVFCGKDRELFYPHDEYSHDEQPGDVQ